MLTDDWMMRQIDTTARSIARLVLQKEDTAYRSSGGEENAGPDALHLQLVERLAAGDAGGGEDLLFEASDRNDLGYLDVAVDFYCRLNQWTDEQLEQAGFEREELQEGLETLARRFGVIL